MAQQRARAATPGRRRRTAWRRRRRPAGGRRTIRSTQAREQYQCPSSVAPCAAPSLPPARLADAAVSRATRHGAPPPGPGGPSVSVFIQRSRSSSTPGVASARRSPASRASPRRRVVEPEVQPHLALRERLGDGDVFDRPALARRRRQSVAWWRGASSPAASGRAPSRSSSAATLTNPASVVSVSSSSAAVELGDRAVGVGGDARRTRQLRTAARSAPGAAPPGRRPHRHQGRHRAS